MKTKCLQAGEPDSDGLRSYTFQVPVNSELIMYQVRARTEQDAQDKLRGYVESDSENLQQLGAAGAAVSFVVIGAIVYGVYLVAREIAKLIPSPKTPAPKRNPKLGDLLGGIKAATGKATGKPTMSAARPAARAASARPASATASSRSAAAMPRSAATSAAPRPAASAGTPKPPLRSVVPRRAPVVNGDTDGAPDDDDVRVAAPGAAQASPARGPGALRNPSWRAIQYKGVDGKIAGGDPTAAIRIVVYSDAPVDALLPLVRQSSYDPATSKLRDPIVVMAFPAAAAEMRASDAMEVMIGESKLERPFDVKAATVEEALTSIRVLLAPFN